MEDIYLEILYLWAIKNESIVFVLIYNILAIFALPKNRRFMPAVSNEIWLIQKRELNFEHISFKSSELNEDLLIKGDTVYNSENSSLEEFNFTSSDLALSLCTKRNSDSSLVAFAEKVTKNLA